MSGVWATSWGWPGPKPAGPFKSYIRRNEQTALHYYAAYPEATVTEILAALELQEAYGRFQERTRGMSTAEFDRAWSELMDEVQPWL
jgi:hypothetical protein